VQDTRRYDLDWLRVGLFLLLIFYHIGMFYVPWQWHVKSLHAPVEWLELPMRILNPWRIPALFIISGIALRFALDKASSHGAFMWRRFVRLILPVLFGMAVVCAPQPYFEQRAAGVDTGNLLEFYIGYLKPPWLSPEQWPTITPTWNHLWYLVYVLLLSLVIIGLNLVSRGGLARLLTGLVNRCARRPVVFLLLPMMVSFFILWIFKHSVGAVQMVWGDWHRLASSLWLMLFGFAIAKEADTWKVLWRSRWVMFLLAVILGAILVMASLNWFWVGSGYEPHYYITRSFYSWAVMLALLGFVQMAGRGSDRLRNYLTYAVFPYYVLHQTVIIVTGVWLGQFQLSFAAEAASLIALTILVTALIHHFVVLRMGRASVLLGGR